MKSSLTLLLILIISHVISQPIHQKDKSLEWPIGKVINYSKSNWDGTNESLISIYFKEGGWIESLKWHEGANQATIISARIDFKTGSIHHFKNIRCVDGDCNQLGEMYFDPASTNYIINFGPIIDTISGVAEYWHSYDFDWASLMVAFLHKEEPSDHQFMRYDFTMVDGKPGFGKIGKVVMNYKGIQQVNNRQCHLYTIDGTGLENKGGKIWFDVNENLLMGYKIELPDEDSYQNVNFQFISTGKMKVKEWESFKKSKSIAE